MQFVLRIIVSANAVSSHCSLPCAVHAQCNIEFNVHRYSASQPQRGLRLHRDHSHVSFNVALNHLSEYVHGGGSSLTSTHTIS